MQRKCQSCGMVIDKESLFGTNEDGSKSQDYCCYCYNNGKFGSDETMEEMIESCIPFRLSDGTYKNEETARASMREEFIHFKRWSSN
ncbi:MAG TPA: transcriptional regulator [Lachnospiraceae bacterium]|nr:zinc ribbon domain-containing protein [uncultured Lachnoclostridium sp.]HAU86896.1 transcriptional regulator [Lachnospiraceae bacterium]